MNLTVYVTRAGSPAEVRGFLKDLEAAYQSLADFDAFLQARAATTSDHDEAYPVSKLGISRIQVGSPGFWEFVGTFNPLELIRRYLKDAHQRRQDREYRESAEAERLHLENEHLHWVIWGQENSVLKERIDVLRGLGYSDAQIRHLVWGAVGNAKRQSAGFSKVPPSVLRFRRRIVFPFGSPGDSHEITSALL